MTDNTKDEILEKHIGEIPAINYKVYADFLSAMEEYAQQKLSALKEENERLTGLAEYFSHEFDLSQILLREAKDHVERLGDALINCDQSSNTEKVEIIKEYESRIKELEQWKESAIKVMPDFQQIGKLLNIPLGTSVSEHIIPGIKKLLEHPSDAVEVEKLIEEIYQELNNGGYSINPRNAHKLTLWLRSKIESFLQTKQS